MKKHAVAKPAKARRALTRPVSEVIECCRHITTLAGLLAQCGQVRQAEPIAPQLISNAGDMIAAESRAVGEFLEQLDLEMRRSV
jgi:hypothetical protein